MMWQPVTFRRILITVIITVLAMALLPLLARWIVQRSIGSAIHSFEKKTGFRVSVGTIDFPDLQTVVIRHLNVCNQQDPSGTPADTLIEATGMTLRFNFAVFFHRSFFREICIDSLRLVLHWDTGGFNLSPVFGYFRQSLSSSETVNDTFQQSRFPRLNADIFLRFPDIFLRHVSLDMRNSYREWIPERRRFRIKEETLTLRNAQLEIRNHRGQPLQGELRGKFSTEGESTQLLLSGQVNLHTKRIVANLMFDRIFRFPFLSRWIGADVGFRGMDLTLDEILTDSLTDHWDLQTHWHDLAIFSDAVSFEKIQGIDLRTRLKTDVTPDSLFIHPQSHILIGQIKIFLSGTIRHLSDQPDIRLKLELDSIAFDDFFASVPPVLMNRLTGIRLQGWMRYVLDIRVNWAHPDSITIHPRPYFSPDFRMIRLSDSIDISRYRGSFEHRIVTEAGNDSFFVVGIENPYFTPLDSIPPHLVHVILISEDGSYFTNNGFNILQIERSIAENIREKKFVRGASTLSMQLVKNLFLSREKTLSRKFQELILTWLINRDHLLDEKKNKEQHKKRGLEIYLNIIEWGPDVYGIGRAAEFYFRKKPSALTPKESAFLTMLLPNPKKYERYFYRGDLRKSRKQYMEFLIQKLAEQGILTREESLSAASEPLIVSGEALPWIFQAAYRDSAIKETEEEIRF